MEFEVTGRDANGEYDKNANIKLVDNFFPYLFPRSKVKKHDYSLEKIDCARVTSTAMVTYRYSRPQSYALKAGGLK
jgi:hypothetical protein